MEKEKGNTEEVQNRIAHVHDAFVRTAMQDPRIAREFFTIHLPTDIREVINLDHLILQPRSYIDDVRKESTVDLLYKTKMGKEEAYLYLLVEHQSSPDKFMAFRLLKYTCNIMDHHLKYSKQKTLPLVYPLVIYHDERPYPYSTDIRDTIAGPRELIDRYFLKPFQLLDLGIIDDQELKRHALVGIMEFVLKHIRARNLLSRLEDFAEPMRWAVQSGGQDFISIVLQYTLECGQIENRQAFFKLINTRISSEVGEKIMTLGEQLRAEGILEGKLEVAKRLLAKGTELAFVAEITGLSLDKLKIFHKDPVKA